MCVSQNISVAIARVLHLFPFRTEKLRLSAPMVLGGRLPGRVGRRRFLYQKRALKKGLFLLQRSLLYLLLFLNSSVASERHSSLRSQPTSSLLSKDLMLTSGAEQDGKMCSSQPPALAEPHSPRVENSNARSIPSRRASFVCLMRVAYMCS